MREQILVALDSENAPCRDGARGTFFPISAVLTEGNLLVSVKGLEAAKFLFVAFKPNFAVRVRIRKSF